MKLGPAHGPIPLFARQECNRCGPDFSVLQPAAIRLPLLFLQRLSGPSGALITVGAPLADAPSAGDAEEREEDAAARGKGGSRLVALGWTRAATHAQELSWMGPTRPPSRLAGRDPPTPPSPSGRDAPVPGLPVGVLGCLGQRGLFWWLEKGVGTTRSGRLSTLGAMTPSSLPAWTRRQRSTGLRGSPCGDPARAGIRWPGVVPARAGSPSLSAWWQVFHAHRKK